MLATEFRHFCQTAVRLLVWVWISFKLGMVQAPCNKWLLYPEFQQQVLEHRPWVSRTRLRLSHGLSDKCSLVAEVWPSNAVVCLHNTGTEDLTSWPMFSHNTLSSNSCSYVFGFLQNLWDSLLYKHQNCLESCGHLQNNCSVSIPLFFPSSFFFKRIFIFFRWKSSYTCKNRAVCPQPLNVNIH